MEEKVEAIDTLSVLIEEVGGPFVEYLETTSTILLKYLSYPLKDSIRQVSAEGLPGLVHCC